MHGWRAVYYRELLILRRRLGKQLLSMSVTPTLYLVAFGFGMGGGMEAGGRPYVEFLLPGLVAMSSMNHGYAIASEINIARFYWRIFEEFQAAPIPDGAIVAGEVAAGVTRALLAAAVIMGVAALFGVSLSYGPASWVAVGLNGFVFASLAVAAAMVVSSHADQALLANFVITPMAFLGGTVFPVDAMPELVRGALWLLPLTHASGAIRQAAWGEGWSLTPYMVMTVCALAAFLLARRCVGAARG